MDHPPPTRIPLPGSCHCSHTTYILFLSLPHPFSSSNPPTPTSQEIYRCNCTACLKMDFLHVNPANPATDFMLLSPLDPDRELSVYTCFEGKLKYYFCKRCGVRCFTFGGAGEVVSLNVPSLDEAEKDVSGGESKVTEGNKEESKEMKKRKVWRPKWNGDEETRPYLSVNGTTIEPDKRFDIRVLSEEKRIQYFDGRSRVEEEKEPRWERPHYGGVY